MATTSVGRDLLIYLESETTPGTFDAVAGQRSINIKEETEAIETTTKLSGRAKTYVAGLYDCTISCDGLYVFGQTEYEALKTRFRDGDMVKVRVAANGGTKADEAMAVITSFEREGDYDAETTYSMELQVSGGFTEVTLP